MHWTGKPVRAYSSLKHPSRRLADRNVAVLTNCCNELRNDICSPRGVETHRAARDRQPRCPGWEAPMSCCDETTARVPDTDLSRRALFKGTAGIARVSTPARPPPPRAQAHEIKPPY